MQTFLKKEDRREKIVFRLIKVLFWRKVSARRFLGAAVFIHLCFFSVFAERLPLKIYSTADGLANDAVNRIVPDSHGFLWFCTGEGLSRFDGYRFKNYTQDEGLPHRNITDFLETDDGTYLIATSGGLAVFNPNGKAFRWNILEGKLEQTSDEPPLFKTFRTPDSERDNKISKNIDSLAQDGSGNVYAATSHGLFKVFGSGGDWRFEKVEYPEWKDKLFEFNFLFTDSKKDVWLAASNAIYWLSKNGEISKIADSGGNHVFETKDGRIWVDSGGNDLGIRVFSRQGAESNFVQTSLYSKKDGLPKNIFTNIAAETADGRIFVSSDGRLCEFFPEAKGNEPKFRVFEDILGKSATDQSGNIWFNVPGKGAARYSPYSFIVLDKRDGVPDELISSIFGNREGDVFLTAGNRRLVRVKGEKIESLIPSRFGERNWIDTFLGFQTGNGEFWLTGADGLFHYPKVENFNDLSVTAPSKIYTTADGLNSNAVFAAFEDSRGDIWISATDADNSVMRLEKATGKIHRYTFEDGLPKNSGAIAFGEDAAGGIWIGFYFGQIVRYRDGKFRSLTDEGLIPNVTLTKTLVDKQNRFWLATASRGLFRVDDPDAETPVFTNFSTANGLSSNQTLCLTVDAFGRIYTGTGRGINRLEPETGRIKIFTQNDGLPGNIISQCYTDTNGNLWFSSNNSLIKLVPTADRVSASPPILIDAVTVNGKPRNISELGEKEIKNLELAPDERQIQIGFLAISFDSGETLRYQYKLEGQDWSEPTEQRSVDFNLSAGSYGFAVRAVNSKGVFSPQPALVAFTIQSPVYQRWWFIALAALVVTGLIFALDRYRVAKTRQVEAALDETRRAGKLIQESETRYRTLAETASDAIITIDTDSNIVYCNDAAEQIFGYTSAELLGKPLVFLMPERFRPMHDAGLNRYLNADERTFEWSAVELPGLHKDGTEIPLELSFGEFEKDGERFFTGIARDITERKKSEAALQKAREERINELQRVRTRIATDLHDDIGSSLTQIAVYSEVARQREPQNGAAGESLDMITNVANELVDTMSDIVWAINPKKDHLQDLTQRMRRFAANVLTGKDIDLEFHAPDSSREIPLGANIRREVFLIFKETVNNIVKHSGASEAQITFALEENFLAISFRDNGRGFDPQANLSDNSHHDWKKLRGGNGLQNMRRRAEDLGGTYEIESAPGTGTTVNLQIPVKRDE